MRRRTSGGRGCGRTGLRVGLVLVAASALLRSGPAVAQDDGTDATDAAGVLAGYNGRAAASGVRANYNPQGLLPIAAPVDLGVPDALATIASGPSTFARSSVADPGDLLANPSALLGLAEPSLSGSVPAYPYRVSAASGIGKPTDEVSPAPGLNARVKADEDGSTATATLPVLQAPAVLTAGTLSASASTSLAGGTLTVHARSAISGVDLLGLLKIDAVTTDLTATSTGGQTTLEGGTKVVGAELLGMPVTIDANGIRPVKGNGAANPLIAAIDQAFKASGIRIALASPVDLAGGSAGQLTAAGLRIDLELSEKTFPALGQLFDTLPPMDALIPGLPSVEDVLAAARARHLASVVVGGASVSLTATSIAPLGDDLPIGGDLPPTFVAPIGSGVSLDPISPPAVVPTPVAPATERTSVGFGEGVGGLALLLLVLQPVLGDRLARWATTLLAADGAGSCPREGR